jgi:hypothetical protein
MKSTINPALVNLLRQNDPEVEFRLEAQEAALKEIPCRNPIVGRWITQIDVEHLLSALDLDDISFAERFPSIAHLGHERRQRMKDEFAHHLDHCQHCSLKHSYELELDARIMRLWRQNKDSLLQLLDEGGIDLSEGEHLPEELDHVIEYQPVTHPEPEIIINPLVEPIY